MGVWIQHMGPIRVGTLRRFFIVCRQSRAKHAPSSSSSESLPVAKRVSEKFTMEMFGAEFGNVPKSYSSNMFKDLVPMPAFSSEGNQGIRSSMEGLKLSDVELMVYIHPSRSRNVFKAICRELSALLFQYNESFDGVLLAYDFTVKRKQATILAGLNPYIGVRANTRLLLFNPEPNSLIEGKIVKLSPESIHVVVLGFSAAVVTDFDIREEFKYKVRDGKGCFVSRSHKRHALKVGTMLRLQVKSFDEEVMHIAGSLLPANTGCVKWLEKQSEEALNMDRDHKRRKIA